MLDYRSARFTIDLSDHLTKVVGESGAKGRDGCNLQPPTPPVST